MFEGALPQAPEGDYEVRLLPPLQPPTVRDFVAFEEHVEGVRRSIDGEGGVVPEWYEAPTFYFTNPYPLYGPHDDVPLAPGSQRSDFELEVIDEDTWHPHVYDFSQPEVSDQWGTANAMNEFVAQRSFNDPDKGLFVAPPV